MATSSEESETKQKVEFIRQFSQERSKQVVNVTAGKSGVGKSTLINTFLQLEGPEACQSRLQATSVTDSVAPHDRNINGVNVRVIDMPGLHADDHDKEKARKTLAELNALTEGKADVVFYCVNILNRLDKIDWENIDTLTHTFGKGIWNHAVVVFTWTDVAE